MQESGARAVLHEPCCMSRGSRTQSLKTFKPKKKPREAKAARGL